MDQRNTTNEGANIMKHVFIMNTGEKVMVDSWVNGPKLPNGYWWEDQSALGSGESVWKAVVKPHDTKGKIFGYEERAFMARQYK